MHVYGCKDILQISIEEALRKAKLWRGGYVLAYTCHRDPPGELCFCSPLVEAKFVMLRLGYV